MTTHNQPASTHKERQIRRVLIANRGAVAARVIRAGKSLVFGEIDIVSTGDGKSVCRASTTYALL